MKMSWFIAFFVVNFILISVHGSLQRARDAHSPNELTVNQLRYLSKQSNTSHIDKILDNILIPRVVGTPNHEKVYNYLVGELETLGWKVEIDSFTDKTPNLGELKFRNIIGTLNPNADRYLVLACHYDSKYFEKVEFVGATDSAVPCAMILNLLYVMRDELDSVKNKPDVSLKVIFFDGEEAFVNWGPNDSIYGAKHLAQMYEKSTRQTNSGEVASELDRIDILVLLDLLGAKNPTFVSFFRNTDKWYQRFVRAEHRLANAGQLKNYNSRFAYFRKHSLQSFMEDDHIPFLRRGVPILHIIPVQFPEVWHTEYDNREVIDMPTVENLNKIFRVFIAEYLHLSILEDADSGEKESMKNEL